MAEPDRLLRGHEFANVAADDSFNVQRHLHNSRAGRSLLQRRRARRSHLSSVSRPVRSLPLRRRNCRLAGRALRQFVSRAAALRLFGLRFFGFPIALYLTLRHCRLPGLRTHHTTPERGASRIRIGWARVDFGAPSLMADSCLNVGATDWPQLARGPHPMDT